MPIKISLLDDHPMILDGLVTALSSDTEIEIIGNYQSGKELFTYIRKDTPDILLLDLQLPDKNGQEVAMQVLHEFPEVKIIILSSIDSPLVIQDMMKEGCKSYLLKATANKNTILHAIKTVFKGDIFLEPEIQKQLLENVLVTPKIQPKNNRKLTGRERDVLQLIAMEYTNQQIADKLFVSLRTVENHRHSLMQKLEIKNAIGLVKAAMEFGLIK